MVKDKKFFLVHLFDDFSGSPRVMSELSKALSNLGYSHEAIIGSSSKGFISELGLICHKFLYSRSDNKIFTLLFYLLSQVCLFFLTLALVYRNRGKDVVFVINTLLPFGAALGAKMCGAKVVYYCHEVSLRPQIMFAFLKFVLNLTASKVVFVSNYVGTAISLKEGIMSRVIYNPLPDSFVAPTVIDGTLYSRWKRKNILMLCSLKDYKGVLEFVNLSKTPDLSTSFSFTLVLNEDVEAADLYFSSVELSDNFHYICRPNNIVELYNKSFLVLNLSNPQYWIETFGLTLLEGMSQGNPVISPLVGGPTEFVEDNVNGFHIHYNNYEKLTEVILSLGGDYKYWKRLSKNALDKSSYFSHDRYKDHVRDFLS